VNSEGIASLGGDPDDTPYYMEAELNSPMCRLRPAESCSFETEWFPTRAGTEFHAVTDAGIVVRPLQVRGAGNSGIHFSGSFGVFFAGRLVARIYDEHGRSLGTMPIMDVSPTDLAVLDKEITLTGKAVRVSLHLEDMKGLDRGLLQEVRVTEDHR
jgi:hypothetical protein